MRKLFGLAVGILALVCSSSVKAQTTKLTQTAAGTNCHVTGCTNAPLSDGELFTYSDTIQFYGNSPINGKLQFRGMHYQMTGNASNTTGGQAIDISSNGFAVHGLFDSDCFRCAVTWDDGYLDVPNEYVTSDPAYYGSSGYPNYTCICSGNGQVGFVSAQTNPVNVTLVTDNPSVIQVPAEVTVLGGTSFTDFAITATVPATGLGAPYTVTITATFPDGSTSVFPLTVQNLPPPTPPDD